MSKTGRGHIFQIFSSVTLIVLLSKAVGFIKQMVTASAFGATAETDVVFLAEGVIGNIQYVLVQVLLTAFTATYIHSKSEDEKRAKQFAMDSAKAFSIIAAVLALLVLIGAPVISQVIAPSYTSEQSAELAGYLRLFAPALVCFVWIAISHALLNSNQRFIPGELIGINQSVILIALVVLFGAVWGVKVLAVGFCLYTVWNTLYLIFVSRRYWGRSVGNPFGNPAVQQLLKMSGPLLLGYSMVYINQQVDKILSSGLQAGTVTAMGYAAVLSNLVGTFITTFCSILFTYITTSISKGDDAGAGKLTVNASILLSVGFLPISILTILCAEDVVAIVYGHGAFDAESVKVASMALVGYGFMFVPLVFRELFSRFQYGYQRSKQPMINSTLGILLNIALSIALSRIWGIFGITFASSVSVVLCGILNALTARKCNPSLTFWPLLRRIPVMIIAGVVCGLIAYGCRLALVDQTPLVRFLLTSLAGGVVYLLIVGPGFIGLLRRQKFL